MNGTSVTIPKLKDGHEYDFRVIAENQNGQSEPLETDAATTAKNPFGYYFLRRNLLFNNFLNLKS